MPCQSEWRNCGLCVSLYAKYRAALWGEHENEKTRINQLMKALVDAVGIKSADLKDKFLF